MSTDYKYGDLGRADKLMEHFTEQGYRPAKVAKLVREMDEASKNVDEAMQKLKDVRSKIKPLCTHAVEDMIYREYGLTDTLGNYDGVVGYLTCKLFGEELYRTPRQ